MNKTSITRWLSFILCVVLIAALALTTIGCNKAEDNGDTVTTAGQAETPDTPTVKGEGATVRRFERFSPEYYLPLSDHSPAFIDIEI